MKLTATVKLKLDVAPESSAALAETQAAYVRALNLTSAVAFEKKVSNAVALHHLTYRDVRSVTGLPSNLVCSARAVVAEAYKRKPGKRHKWRDGASLRYDARTLTLKTDSATLTTLRGRILVGLIIADYHRQFLDGSWEIASTAALVRRGKVWYLHLIAEKEVPDCDAPGVLGVDSGIVKIATASTGKTFGGGTVVQTRRRRFRQRRSLKIKPEGQSRSRSQRRLLKRLSGKETRFVEWKLWNVAGGIVREAVRADCGAIAVEDLKHIRQRIRVAKKQRLIQHGWPFASLIAKIKHVAARHGIAVAEVEARDTSKTCSRCGHCERANRPTQSRFRCLSSGYSHNADYNAAHNIRARYVSPGCGAVTHRLKSAPRGRAKKAAAL